MFFDHFLIALGVYSDFFRPLIALKHIIPDKQHCDKIFSCKRKFSSHVSPNKTDKIKLMADLLVVCKLCLIPYHH